MLQIIQAADSPVILPIPLLAVPIPIWRCRRRIVVGGTGVVVYGKDDAMRQFFFTMSRRVCSRTPLSVLATLLLALLLCISVVSGCQLVGDTEDPADVAEPETDPEPDTGDCDESEPVSDIEFEDLPELLDSLDPVHPDEPAEYTLNERFATGNALGRLGQIREAGEDLEDPEMQMAWGNWTGALEGALMRQGYEIARLQLLLARQQYRAGEIDSEELEGVQDEYHAARESFKQFWNSFSIGD